MGGRDVIGGGFGCGVSSVTVAGAPRRSSEIADCTPLGRRSAREPKTETSRRTVTLPPEAVAALKAHRDRQNFERQRR